MSPLLLSFASLPSFDWNTAGVVFVAVATAAAIAITVAILLPGVPILAGAGLYATFKAVAAVSIAVGLIGATSAGFYRGYEGDKKYEVEKETVMHVSNQLDVSFQPARDTPEQAEDFHCRLVVYEEKGLDTRLPSAAIREIAIEAHSGDEFYLLLRDEMDEWFKKLVLGDDRGIPRRVFVYMRPFPGDGVYERLKQLCTELNSHCVVNRVDGEWQSAVLQNQGK